MSDRTIQLRADLADQLESLAEAQNRSLNDLVNEMIHQYKSQSARADQLLALADGMKKADIAWREMPDASEIGRKAYEDAVYDQWLKTQSTDDE